jgi:hypothetical protein
MMIVGANSPPELVEVHNRFSFLFSFWMCSTTLTTKLLVGYAKQQLELPV